MTPWKELSLAAPFPRLSLGLIFLVAGIHKALAGFEATAGWMTKAFEGTFLPEIAVQIFAYGLIPLEILVGVMLLLGLWRKGFLLTAACLLMLLIVGKLILADHAVVFQNTFYLFLAALGLAVLPFDPCGIDAMRQS
ncbi:MAG TPA: DoxX family membrane protein [Thermoanaerobaculia bacterium]|nr:DoxX family membrane protein [Thermoanaerobaculia bacterium]HUM30436.1 DoxX family membrane protein [Thermoanaerobaculia bacterium]HXK68697.1 DoxX family membrane protein [Thermoanaerobaculia bacterium]